MTTTEQDRAQAQQDAQKIIRLAQLLYEMFVTEPNAPRWEDFRAAGDLPDANTAVHDLWLTRSRALLEELEVIRR